MFRERFVISNFEFVKQQLLIWGSRFSSCCFLDNHQYTGALQQVECMLAAGVYENIQANAGNALEQLQAFIDKHPNEWVFGHLGYDLKQETEESFSHHNDETGFPDLYFFLPQILVQLKPGELIVYCRQPNVDAIFEEIIGIQLLPTGIAQKIEGIEARITKPQYLETVQRLKQHILRGDCYEINYCQEFFAFANDLDLAWLYQKLSERSPNPFSVFYRTGHAHLACASPERYLMKKGRNIYSQPIKGTSTRYPENDALDMQSKTALQQSAKERSENVMVVDLVRNDLSRVCHEGSVKVDELFGIYSYPNVHQMISTISGVLKNDVSFSDIIRATFPMGSMTGAPKKKVLSLIEKYEPFRRGLFSGSVGYISPSGDFDFNVVIRSIFYNSASGRLSFMAGSGITWYSEAEKEFEECRVKANTIRQLLEEPYGIK